MRKKPLLALAGIIVVFFLWLAFRPELLFVNKAVNEPLITHSQSKGN